MLIVSEQRNCKLFALFPPSEVECTLWARRHAATPNWHAERRRVVVFMGYGCEFTLSQCWRRMHGGVRAKAGPSTPMSNAADRWLKPRDAMYVEEAIKTLRCPIQRQLLGATTQMSGLYHGNGLDIPLKQWLHTKGGSNALDGVGWQLPSLGQNDTRGMGHAPMSRLPGEVGRASENRQNAFVPSV